MLEGWRERGLVRRITGLVPAPLSPDLRAAVVETGAGLTMKVLGPSFRPYRDELILIFAKQLADATRRLSSSHWSSGGGRNVGMDVYYAHGRALAALKALAAQRPLDPLDALLKVLDDLMAAQRAAPGDEDGYGIATLGELRRDVERLIAADRRT